MEGMRQLKQSLKGKKVSGAVVSTMKDSDMTKEIDQCNLRTGLSYCTRMSERWEDVLLGFADGVCQWLR